MLEATIHEPFDENKEPPLIVPRDEDGHIQYGANFVTYSLKKIEAEDRRRYLILPLYTIARVSSDDGDLAYVIIPISQAGFHMQMIMQTIITDVIRTFKGKVSPFGGDTSLFERKVKPFSDN